MSCYTWSLLCWVMFLCCPIYSGFFMMKRCFISSNAFSSSVAMIMSFLHFILLRWYITLIDWYMLKLASIPGINPTWSWYGILLMWSWNQFGNILLRISTSIWLGILVYSLFAVSSSGLGIRVIRWGWEYSFISFFRRVWKDWC